jgi:DNA processing protein
MVLQIAAGSPEYPERLLELPDPPLILYASGPLPRADRWLAIVGARKSSERGRSLAERMARQAAELGVGIVSGGAIGIDAAAHRGALEGKGPTIAVLPSPVHRPAPRRNWRLFGDIASSGGALISELDRAPIGKGSFRDRNRMIAALADAVLIVEAGPVSGTRYTAKAARKLGRMLGAVPWEEGDPRGAMPARVLERGGAAIRSIDDLCAWLSLRRPERAPESDPVLAELGDDEMTIDRIASRVGIPIHQLLAHVSRLELSGRIQVLAGSRIRRLR